MNYLLKTEPSAYSFADLQREKETIGAVGISGAPGGEKDEICAKAGIDKVADTLK